MRFDFGALEAAIRYKLLTATITPRPIAWVSTLGPEGVNVAPYSFFNAMGHTPPTVVLGCLTDAARGLKDTARNILETGEFVVNLVPEELAEQMNITCIDAPYGVDEAALAGLELAPSRAVAPPRIAHAPVSFECRLLTAVTPSASQTIIIGQVIAAEIADRAVLNAARGHIDTAALHTIGRMGGAGIYARSADTFEMKRPTWAEWPDKPKA